MIQVLVINYCSVSIVYESVIEENTPSKCATIDKQLHVLYAYTVVLDSNFI